MSSYVENLQAGPMQGPESSAWRGQSSSRMVILSMNGLVFLAGKITPAADRLLIYLKFWSKVCRLSSGARWNCLYLLWPGYTACCWFRVWQLPYAPIWHHHFVFESLLAAHLAHQLMEIWATTAMKFTKHFQGELDNIIDIPTAWKVGNGAFKCEVKRLLDKGPPFKHFWYID
jgi:hypothetical protein